MSDQLSNESPANDGFVWSPEQMIARLGGDEELARQLVTLFLTECPRMMDQVRESVEQGSADVVRRAAHAFKGSVSNFSTSGPMVTALELEHLGREGRVSETPAVLARLELEVASLVEQLRAFSAES